jgi:hypothetical protein
VLDIKGYEGCRPETGAVDLEQRLQGGPAACSHGTARPGGARMVDQRRPRLELGGPVAPQGRRVPPRRWVRILARSSDSPARPHAPQPDLRPIAWRRRLCIAAWEHEPSSSPHESACDTVPPPWKRKRAQQISAVLSALQRVLLLW